MSLKLKPERWDEIVASQAREIARLATDRQYARAMSVQPHFSMIGRWLEPKGNERALEIGCGPGRYVAMLSSLGYRVVGADPSSFPSWDLLRREGVTLEAGVSAEELPYEAASFDAVACMGALLYFKDADRALSEVRRVLKPGGRLVVRTVNRHNLFRLVRRRNLDPATVNLFTERELRAFVERHGFAVHETSTYTFHPPVFSGTWWYLINCKLSIGVQQRISALCPRGLRTNVSAFATRLP